VTEFKLIRELGLSTINPAQMPGAFNLNQEFIRAADLEALLESGRETFNGHGELGWTIPLPKKESAEDVLRDFIDTAGHAEFDKLVERAKRVLK